MKIEVFKLYEGKKKNRNKFKVLSLPMKWMKERRYLLALPLISWMSCIKPCLRSSSRKKVEIKPEAGREFRNQIVKTGERAKILFDSCINILDRTA